MTLSNHKPQLLYRLVHGVFVRGIPGGSLEQVIFRLDLLHGLYDSGVTIFNTPKSIERTVDKPLTSILLNRAGLPTPRTWICENTSQANEILKRESRDNKKIVLKPLFGSQGIGMHLVDKRTGLVYDEKFAGVYYLQEFIERKNNTFTDKYFNRSSNNHTKILTWHIFQKIS